MTNKWPMTAVAALMVILALVSPVLASTTVTGTIVNQGAIVFIGEEGLNITNAMGGHAAIGWWASAASIEDSSPSKMIEVSSRLTTFSVTSSEFVGYTGNWYRLDSTTGKADGVAFNVYDPQLDLKIWDAGQSNEVSGKTVTQGTNLTFRIDTNILLTAPGTLRRNEGGNTGKPFANFTASGATPYTFTNKTNNSPSEWQWIFTGGTPATSADQNPADVIFAPDGAHTVTLTATNISGYGSIATGVFTVTAGTGVLGTVTTTYLASTEDLNPATDGFIKIKVKTDTGATLTSLYDKNGIAQSLTDQFVNTQPFFWHSNTITLGNWSTGVIISGQYAYPSGVYTVWAESDLNRMKDNYKNSGADYTGKTVSEMRTITLASSTVKITPNKEIVTRSKPFSVTITGAPATEYYLWIKGTHSMDGGADDQPPMIKAYQEGVTTDIDPNMTYPIGEHLIGTSTTRIIKDDVATAPYNGTLYYCKLTTSLSGTRVVEFNTNNWTKAQKYTFHVESTDGTKSDETTVRVEKGAVSITASGDQSYYLGEAIEFSGTNTETQFTYLFLLGANLPSNGAQINTGDPRNAAVIDGNITTFQQVFVDSDNTWDWEWSTATVALDAGTYTIYAVSQPVDRENLENVAYGTVSIVIKKPFVSATASRSVVAKGDKILITGTAEGKPSPGVAIWVLGKNFVQYDTESIASDASFSYEVHGEETKNLASGQYFVVVQHPMQNDQFDIVRTVVSNDVWVTNLQLGGGMKLFKIEGASSLQGTDAAEALVQAINDPNVDDTYTKLAFLVEEPLISIDAIGDKHVGNKFTITATTNLAVDDEIFFEVYSSSFKPTSKSQSGEFSGATGTIKVVKGDSGLNKLTFDVDASTFKPDEYIVKASAIVQDATGSAMFNVLEGAAPTAVPTAVITAAPTAVPPTAAPTTAATPTKTPTQPGFGALIALIGLGAVAFLVERKQ